MQMLSQGSALSPSPALWCAELLFESPSTASFGKCSTSTAIERAESHQRSQNRHSTRKQPLCALPNNGCSDVFFDQQVHYQTQDIISYKYRMSDLDLNKPQRAFVPVDLDKTIHWDNRALKSLLDAERQDHHLFRDFWHLLNKQKDFNYTYYRSETVKWLIDVCDAEGCDLGIFPLTVSYLNRVLFIKKIPPANLQALASACLFLASKMKAPQPITAKRISLYSECTVEVDTILSWEMIVVNLLEWDISLHTVFEFFDQLMVRSPALECLRDSFCTASLTIQLDETLCCLLPSVQCSLLVCALTQNSSNWAEYQKLVKDTLNTDVSKLECYMYRLSPQLTPNNDYPFQQQQVDPRHQRSVYHNTNPFIALV